MNIDQEKIETILNQLGYNLTDRGSYWQTNAIYRDGDNRTALQIWKDTGIWRDFVANTGYLPFKKLLTLSARDKDAEVEQLIKDLENNEISDFERRPIQKMQVDQFSDHNEIKTLFPHYKFYNNKGISDSTLKLYNAGFSMSGKMNGRFVFPVYDENAKIIGITGRHLLWKDDSNISKWKHIGKKSNWIYPINIKINGESKFQNAVESTKEIILIEGIGDSLALSEQNIYNHLVVFGLEISSKQIAYLMSQNLNKITISTNNDSDKISNRGLEAAIKIYLKLSNFFDVSKLEIRLPVTKDFGDMLENGVSIDKWRNKRVNRISQIEYIIKYLYNNKDKTSFNKIDILKNYKEQLNAERNSICQ